MNQKRRRSWLGTLSRISLKMSLVLVAVVAVAMAWVADAWHQRQRETALLNRMKQSLSLTLSIERPTLDFAILGITWSPPNRVVVDYRGPKFLQPFCQRWNLDLFDRVVEIQLLEETPLLQESVQNCPELQTLTLAPRFSAEDSNAWVKVAKQVQDLPVEAFLNVYEREGKLFPYNFVVLGARRSEPWAPHTGYRRHSIAEYLQDQELKLAEVVKQATEAAQRDSVIATCELNSGLLACAAKSPTP